MQDNEKPIVFLSHSSSDKAPLLALKQILDERAAGSLNFFLSSDGESIKFGRNWVVRVSDALKQAKLMFVFLSPQSADSMWIHFEAGCAYAQDIRVVPVCLPGIDLNRITPPLSLLQGFNFHSNEVMGNIARICNETFQLKINESFSPNEFNIVVSKIPGRGTGFFGDLAWAIESIQLSSRAPLPSPEFNPFAELSDLCNKAGMKCHSFAGSVTPNVHNPTIFSAKLEVPGCIGNFNITQTQGTPTPRAPGQTPSVKVEPPQYAYGLHLILSPELFHVNAPLLDQWIEQKHFKTPFSGNVVFSEQIKRERERHRLTTKLYQCGIEAQGLNDEAGFRFEDFVFNLTSWRNNHGLSFTLDGKLNDTKLAVVIGRMFTSRALWEHQPDLTEMFQGT
jgi:hypothetical protein